MILPKPIPGLTRCLSPKMDSHRESLWLPAPAAPAFPHVHPLLSHAKPHPASTPPACTVLPGRSAAAVRAANLQSGLPSLLPQGLTQVLCFPQLLIPSDENCTAPLNLLRWLQASVGSALQKKLLSKYKGKYCHIGVFLNPAPFLGGSHPLHPFMLGACWLCTCIK